MSLVWYYKPDDALPVAERRFVCIFNFLGWWHWSIGVHLDVRHPHLFVHVPFGYVCLGWRRSPTIDRPHRFGYDGWQRDVARERDLYLARVKALPPSETP